jgi:5-methylcytosine-specific restriction protein B
MTFCEQARQSPDSPHVMIIDEINRANLAQVFGELMYLLEYRNESIPLAAGGAPFTIPNNVRIIGTMNTADRSIALVDHALRRRFAFIQVPPSMEVLRRYHAEREQNVDDLIELLERLNRAIADPDYELGVSFFLIEDLATHLADIWQMEIEPYLEELFFNRHDQIKDFRWAEIEKRIKIRQD